MERSYIPSIRKYQNKKITLISGPRQAGKTTLAKMLFSSNDYINFDSADDRETLFGKNWDRNKEQIIFDERNFRKLWI